MPKSKIKSGFQENSSRDVGKTKKYPKKTRKDTASQFVRADTFIESLLSSLSWSPDWIQEPYSWIGHMPFAFWLMGEIRPKVFVELGTHTGDSYFSFCQAVRDKDLLTRCYAVDTWKGDSQAGFYENEIYEMVFRHNESQYKKFSAFYRMTFDEAIAQFQDRSIDLLHIDGLHTYEAVRNDFESWLPKLAPGALVLFHDTQVMYGDFGVWKLWEELKTKYPENIEFAQSYGLGVIQLPSPSKKRERAWLREGMNEKKKLIEVMSAAGDCLMTKVKLQKLEGLAVTNQTKVDQSKIEKPLNFDLWARIQLVNHAVRVRNAMGEAMKTIMPVPFSWNAVFHRIFKLTKLFRLKDSPSMTTSPDRPSFWRRLKQSIRKRKNKWVAKYRFDKKFYFEQYDDVKLSGIDAFEHYLKHGIAEERQKKPNLRKQVELDPLLFPNFQRKAFSGKKIFVGIMPEVLLGGEPSPCSYIRLLLPLHRLSLKTNTYQFQIVDCESIENKKPDILITQRFWEKDIVMAERYFTTIRKLGIKVIYDLDDDLLSLPDKHPDKKYGDKHKESIITILANCDLATFSTQDLEIKYRPICSKSSVLQNRLDEKLWMSSHEAPISRKKTDLRILYMGTLTHDEEVDFLNSIAMKVKNKYGSRVTFVLIGGTAKPASASIWERLYPPPESCENYPKFVTWLARHSFDIALAPFIESEFNKYKSSIKLMDYAALGIPIIATPHPECVQHFSKFPGVSFVYNDPELWIQKIYELMDSSTRLKELGEHNKDLLFKKYSLDDLSNKWEDSISKVAEPKNANTEVHNFEIEGNIKIDRSVLSKAFLFGKGIEIGALHNPLCVAEGVKVNYMDRLANSELREHYPELCEHDLVEVDIIDNGETLKKVVSGSQDFIIANHFIEHCEDPILALKNIFRALRTHGVLYMAVPDKRFTFDIDREETSISHLWADHLEGTQKSREAHFYEWAKFVERYNRTLPEEASNKIIKDRASYLERKNYSIHFHVWTSQTFFQFLREFQIQTGISFKVLFCGVFPSQLEAIFILRKD